MKNGSSDGRIGPAGLLDPTIAAVDGVEFDVFEVGRRDRFMTRSGVATAGRRPSVEPRVA